MHRLDDPVANHQNQRLVDHLILPFFFSLHPSPYILARCVCSNFIHISHSKRKLYWPYLSKSANFGWLTLRVSILNS
jgi:hypothetical protein